MILSNIEIQAALDAKRLIIEPEPSPRKPEADKPCPYDTHSVDLTLGSEISIPIPGTYSFDLTQTSGLADFIARNSDKYTLTRENPYQLKPNQFVLGITRERVALPVHADFPTCLAARIEGKSSRARCGLLIHFTAPTVHPDWDGPLVLEMINLGPASILLIPGMPIAQLIVEEVRGTPFTNRSQFHKQADSTGRQTS